VHLVEKVLIRLFRQSEGPNWCRYGRLDSTVLAHVMKTLNDRYNYGLELFLLSIDEGITGYRDDSLEVSSYCSRELVTHDTGRLSNGINSSTIYH
jgi:hypothetical protein